jgi:hypothetical protein
MTCVRLARGCVVIAGLVALRAARAETPFAPIDVEYRGGEGCPDEAAFLERLHARTMGSWDAGGSDRPRQVLIAVEGSGAAAAVSNQPTTLAEKLNNPRGIAVDADHAYWTDFGSGGTLPMTGNPMVVPPYSDNGRIVMIAK